MSQSDPVFLITSAASGIGTTRRAAQAGLLGPTAQES
jgi:hypothetical protein